MFGRASYCSKLSQMSDYTHEHVRNPRSLKCMPSQSECFANNVFPAFSKSENKGINSRFSSTHKLQGHSLRQRRTSLGVFFRGKMLVDSAHAYGNACFSCSMHSLFWLFSVVVATSVFMSFNSPCVIPRRTPGQKG